LAGRNGKPFGSELYGHEKGALRAPKKPLGADRNANRGTLLLDEIGELPLNTQGKLLRVIQEKEFERVGSSSTLKNGFSDHVNQQESQCEVEKYIFGRIFLPAQCFSDSCAAAQRKKDDIPLLMNILRRNLSGNERPRLSKQAMSDIIIH
jgi:DNA-binding NtrC family response regulator